MKVHQRILKENSKPPVHVLYPCAQDKLFEGESNPLDPTIVPIPRQKSYFLLFSRFDPVKKFELAISALDILHRTIPPDKFELVHLVIAGAYNLEHPYAKNYYNKLNRLITELHLRDRITIIKSPSPEIKHSLFSNCLAVIQTCDFEHFGIVPLEGMCASKPIIAVAACGFLETIVDNRTGVLVPPNNADALAEKMQEALENPDLYEQYGKLGRQRMEEKFSFAVLSDKMISILEKFLKDV